ncbi:MAG TPA: prepilin-type N-terminal cleavage/methylation domain-containing protein [Defluviitoga sp.]|nr:prepilin-type N-terminal cleavage/methylation domain-containing protein [Defluviitoga sp.]HOP23849.1 prepilin-type N-terminal cleavage/methylation domain-containing protein [Defluviitoga sp.]HPZ28404.1 prepilin-type N-terminal cleavage/methylation domain-containing protein [Defluviitoga sp.]HQD62502.1 prepilin-type N-terminal cleavage/methylation domain-containing protein [Defluviitoga sp.]
MVERKFKEGFTLLEVLIVLGIIAILVSIAIPSVKGITTQAKATKVVTDMRNVEIAVLNYSLYNKSLTGLTIDTLVNENYLSTKPENIQITPGASREIKIEYTGEELSGKDLQKIDNNISYEEESTDKPYLLVTY